ncbi:MAG: hypothetical protein PHR82_06825 [Endomicrobiaceae bacterium]|nr:hypothetical protein [Endomicrobiaceae bacterium]
MKKILFSLICFSFCVFACGKAVESEVNKEQIQNKTAEEVQQNQEVQIQEVQGDPDALFQAGKAKLEQSDYQGAIDDFTKSLAIKEAHHVRADLGRAKEASGDLKGALADYTKAIEEEKRGFYYQWRSLLYTKMGKEAEAKKDMAEFEKLPKE